MSYLYSTVVTSESIMGETIPDSYKEVPVAISIPSIIAFYRCVEKEEDRLGNCRPRQCSVVLRDGSEYHLPLSFEQVKEIVDPQGGGNNYQPTTSPYSPTSLTPAI